jgi:hypothetical protein
MTTTTAVAEKLQITLLSGEVIQLALRSWDPEVLCEAIFRRGYFKADDGKYFPAHQIKFVVVEGE